MLTLLSPAGLWALAALALPLALHLWRRPPRTVRLGSLRFLERVTRHRPRDLRWRERVLLAVRLLLLTLLALLLTRPHWRPPSFDRPQYWVLIDPNAVPGGDSLTRLRTLQAAGYETHRLAAGFPKGTAGTTDAGAAGSRPAPNLWSLLREADAGLPAGSSLAVFTPGRLASLRGERPVLSRCRIEWIVTPDRGNTTPSSAVDLPAGPLKVVILHEAGRSEDARYVEAAVRAVAQVSGREISVTVVDTAAAPNAAGVHADWAFWLGNQPPPPSLAAGVANLLSDAEYATPPNPVANRIVSQPGVPGAAALIDSIPLWRRVPAPAHSDEAVYWTDGEGQPLLTRARQGDGMRQSGGGPARQSGTGSDSHSYLGSGHRQWHYLSRFNPEWTDLPRTSALPAWLRAMLLPETNTPLFADPSQDLRRADPAQLPAATATAGAPPVVLPLPRETPGLQGWCWLLAAILFGVERILSHRRSFVFPSAADVPANQPLTSLAR